MVGDPPTRMRRRHRLHHTDSRTRRPTILSILWASLTIIGWTVAIALATLTLIGVFNLTQPERTCPRCNQKYTKPPSKTGQPEPEPNKPDNDSAKPSSKQSNKA